MGTSAGVAGGPTAVTVNSTGINSQSRFLPSLLPSNTYSPGGTAFSPYFSTNRSWPDLRVAITFPCCKTASKNLRCTGSASITTLPVAGIPGTRAGRVPNVASATTRAIANAARPPAAVQKPPTRHKEFGGRLSLAWALWTALARVAKNDPEIGGGTTSIGDQPPGGGGG